MTRFTGFFSIALFLLACGPSEDEPKGEPSTDTPAGGSGGSEPGPATPTGAGGTSPTPGPTSEPGPTTTPTGAGGTSPTPGPTSEPSGMGTPCIEGDERAVTSYVDNCFSSDPNAFPEVGVDPWLRDIITSKLTAGKPYAFSIAIGTGEGRVELYGVDEKCGAPGDLLGSTMVQNGTTLCLEFTPTRDYDHVLFVMPKGDFVSVNSPRLCPTGSCAQ